MNQPISHLLWPLVTNSTFALRLFNGSCIGFARFDSSKTGWTAVERSGQAMRPFVLCYSKRHCLLHAYVRMGRYTSVACRRVSLVHGRVERAQGASKSGDGGGDVTVTFGSRRARDRRTANASVAGLLNKNQRARHGVDAPCPRPIKDRRRCPPPPSYLSSPLYSSLCAACRHRDKISLPL